MVHVCLFIYIAAGHHIWRLFPYPPPGDAAGSLQQGPNLPAGHSAVNPPQRLSNDGTDDGWTDR